MILAAGRGERMRPLTDAVPKPLLDVGGVSLLERHLARLAQAGIREIVVNLSFRGDQIRAALATAGRLGVEVRFSQEPEPPLETAGGIVQALPLLGSGPFLLVNADVLTDFDFAVLERAPSRPTLVMVPNPPHHPRGDFSLADDGTLGHAEPKLTFAGISRLDTQLFEALALAPGPRPLKPILDAAIAAGNLRGLRHDGLWLDIGTPERLEEARRLLART